MKVNTKRTLLWIAILVVGAGLIIAMFHRSASAALICAGGIFGGISLLTNVTILHNSLDGMAGAVRANGYDRRGRVYSRSAVLFIIAGMAAALAGY